MLTSYIRASLSFDQITGGQPERRALGDTVSMSYGLSDRDRERLERSRQEAAEKMAAERERLEQRKREEAEREAKAEEEKQRLGPRTVAGPDGVPVLLSVGPSGLAGAGVADPMDLEGCLVLLPVIVVVALVGWLSHMLVHRRGYSVYAKAEGRKVVKFREKSKDAASQRLQQLAAAIERDGLAALG